VSRRRDVLAAFAGIAGGGLPIASAQGQGPNMKSLGGDRYQIGTIVVDKAARRFNVPGRVQLLGKPLEYLATSPGGMKAYETLFELDAVGSEFNLACILVGLDRDPNLVQVDRGSREPLPGPRVAISVAWTQDGKRRQMSAAEAVLNPEARVKPADVAWVYIGAPGFGSTGRFPADTTGTLIGFSHDPNCVIESAVGIGVGAYGSVRGSPQLPPVGSPIELVVDAAAAAK
jgi:hypothetical protein